MELRQLRYFVRVVELGSMGRAAIDLNLVQSALSQQIARLEGELATRLLHRTPRGVAPTEAGAAFFREARLTLRHAEQAARAAQQARLSGTVTMGLAPTTSAVLGLPLMQAMRASLPRRAAAHGGGHVGPPSAMLHARDLDLAVLFDSRLHQTARPGAARAGRCRHCWRKTCFLMRGVPPRLPAQVTLADLQDEPLIRPPAAHGLRSTLTRPLPAPALHRAWCWRWICWPW